MRDEAEVPVEQVLRALQPVLGTDFCGDGGGARSVVRVGEHVANGGRERAGRETVPPDALGRDAREMEPRRPESLIQAVGDRDLGTPARSAYEAVPTPP